jgi:hypothetical protein
MAEIRVEKKKTTNIWPWIIGLVLVVLVLWGVMAMTDRNRNDNGSDTRTSALQPAPVVLTLAA